MKKSGLQQYRKSFIKILSIFMVVFPWITYLHISEYSEAEMSIFGGHESIDFFIYYKELAIILMAVLALVWLLKECFLPQKTEKSALLLKDKNKGLFIFVGIFSLWTIVSTVCSKYQKNALWGSPTEGEGIWVLLGYIIILLAFYNAFANTHALDMAKFAITVLSGITVILTLIEWFYKPLLEIGLIQALVAPSKYSELISQMEATVFENAIALSFFNPGNFGGFVCLLLPFMLLYAFQEKILAKKVLYVVLLVGLLFAVLACNTTTALYISIIEMVVVFVIYMLCSQANAQGKKSKLWIQTSGILGVAVAGLFISGIITGNSILNIFFNSNSLSNQVVENRFEMKDIQFEKNVLSLVGKEATLKVYYIKNKILFFDENDKGVAAILEDSTYKFKDEAYADISLSLKTVGDKVEGVLWCLVVDAGYKDTIEFFILEDGSFAGIGQNAAIVTDVGDVATPEALKKIYGLFTGRGYMWVNSLPILKDTLLIGKGPGNFAYYFKQNDYVGLLSTHGTIKHVIDKPHNAYLQYAINLGLPAAVGFFGVFVYALIKGVKVLLMKKKQLLEAPILLGGMVSIIGFLMYSFINDSMVTVTPMACMIVGLLLASCYVEESLT